MRVSWRNSLSNGTKGTEKLGGWLVASVASARSIESMPILNDYIVAHSSALHPGLPPLPHAG